MMSPENWCEAVMADIVRLKAAIRTQEGLGTPNKKQADSLLLPLMVSSI
jgi:hypothetical protein